MSFGQLGSLGRLGAGGGGGAPWTDFANAEAATLVAAMTVEPNIARKELIDNLVGSLKSAGIWTELDIFYVLAAHDSQAALLNWKNPATFTGIPVNSPTFTTDRGYTGDGSTSRVRTQFTPSTDGVNYILDDASIWAWSRTAGTGAQFDMGSVTAPRCGLLLRNGSNQMAASVNAGSNGAVANTDGSGLLGATRANNTTIGFFRNGASLGTAALASTAVANQEQWICGGNATNFSSKQIAAAAWGSSLAGLEASFYTAIATYMTAVGA